MNPGFACESIFVQNVGFLKRSESSSSPDPLWPTAENGGAPEEGDNVEGQKYRFLEVGGLEDQLDYHLSTFVAAIENQDVDALRNALDGLNDMDIDINEAVEACDTALHLACPYGPLPCVQVIRISSNIRSVLLEVHLLSKGCWIQLSLQGTRRVELENC
ncbi:hypothetical protein MLD38_035413 [Melastoma candidum]|uniref:Uncharacterized protein n=1 Tax=Melastoma candidum TaxID=119954 RepID=A0ACB9LGK7_9MYRT|nr:hypothetical protein MLD38_035413 [Melastoma candidum]